ncbi:MAG TPA: hypothetical protein VFM70_02715 [Salinimicrobium sp.]|nr:hypothetical protein [Salinimicrobium sp.]
METYVKYEFDEVPDLSHIEGDVVIVGKLTLQEGVYDEDGNEMEPPIISDKIAVDIIWRTEPLEELEIFRVTPTTPKHTISGQNELYQP